jgi:hypothetical protein
MDINNNSDFKSATSTDIFEPGQKKHMCEKKHQMLTLILILILILIFFKIILTVMFIHIILTNKKYEALYDSGTNRFIISLNVLLSYIKIGIIIFLLVYFNKQICYYIKNKTVKDLYIILLFFFFIFIISTLRFTYILINFDEYKNKDFCFLTYYYTLIQFLSIVLIFSYFL